MFQNTIPKLEIVGHNGFEAQSLPVATICPYDEVLEALSWCDSEKPHLTGPTTGT